MEYKSRGKENLKNLYRKNRSGDKKSTREIVEEVLGKKTNLY